MISIRSFTEPVRPTAPVSPVSKPVISRPAPPPTPKPVSQPVRTPGAGPSLTPSDPGILNIETGENQMGLLRTIGRVAKAVGTVLPGPVGLAARGIGSALGSTGKKSSAAASLQLPVPMPPSLPAPFPMPPVLPIPAPPGVGGPTGSTSAFADFIRRLGRVDWIQFLSTSFGNWPKGMQDAWNQFQSGNGNDMSTHNGNGSDIEALLGPNRVVVEPELKLINSAPPGFVIVDMPDGSGKKAVRREVARMLGLWKPRKKPPISASDWGKLKAADRVAKKAKRIADTAGFKCTKKAR